jgi:hypothetical protein
MLPLSLASKQYQRAPAGIPGNAVRRQSCAPAGAAAAGARQAAATMIVLQLIGSSLLTLRRRANAFW